MIVMDNKDKTKDVVSEIVKKNNNVRMDNRDFPHRVGGTLGEGVNRLLN